MTQAASDSLLWIKGALDSTLESARQGLERYVEDDDSEGLEDCLRSVRQTHGTLRMVEVRGGAMLAEEMEALAQAVADGAVQDTEPALEVLTRGLIQLPDYLERIVGGQEDVPLALLSLINDMRSAQGRPLLSESDVFARDISQRRQAVEPVERTGEAVGDAQAVARKLRPKFQRALLGWYRNDNKPKFLKALSKISEKLEEASETPPVFQLWWVAGGVFEALLDGGIEADVSLKQRVGRLDREVKRLAMEGENAFREDAPDELLNTLLYYVGRARSEGERVQRIRESFGLEEFLPDSERVEAVERSLTGPNRSLMETVSSAIKEDIARVKDALDIHVRLEGSDPQDLAQQTEILAKVADTLGMLGLEDLKESVGHQGRVLTELSDGTRPVEDSTLLQIASTLIEAEQELDREMRAAAGGARHEAEEDDQDPEISGAVIRECIVNIARIKERIQDFVKAPTRKELLEPIPQLVSQIQGSLNLLELDRAGEILEATAHYIRDRIFAAGQAPSEQDLDRLADAVVSTEFYLETMQQGRGRPESMLDNAEHCISELGYRPGALPSRPVESIAPGPEASPEGPSLESAEVEEAPGQEGLEVTEESDEAPDEVPAEPAETESQSATGEVATPAAAKKKPVPRPEDIAPEIVEIFLEEAEEELARLREYYPAWRDNPNDQDALVTVRRSFHTLKGSGRMVGAEFIGEYAWSFENMLNRVLDQTIEPVPQIGELVGQGIDAIPELVEQLKGGPDPETDVVALMEAADAFSRGETPAPVEAGASGPAASTPESEGAAEPETESQASSAEGEGAREAEASRPAMDPTLYEIFRNESERHLDTLDRIVEDMQGEEHGEISDELLRALHTLNGSAHTAGVDEIPRFIGPLERLALAMRASGTPVGPAFVEVLRTAAETNRRMIEQLPTDQGPEAVPEALLERISELHAEVPDEESEDSENSIGDSLELDELTDEPPQDDTLSVPDDDSVAGEEDKLETPSLEGISLDESEDPLDSNDASSAEEDSGGATSLPEPPAPEPPAAAPAERKTIALEDLPEYDPDLASVFLEEAIELSEAMDEAIQEWNANKDDNALVATLQRHLHTLKGGARMSGISPLGDLSHEMETILTKAVDGKLPVSAEMIDLLQRCVDRVARMIEQVEANQPLVDGTDLEQALKRMDARGGRVPEEEDESPELTDQPAPSEATEEPESSAPMPPESEAERSREPARDQAVEDFEERRGATRLQQEVIRVQADLLENLLNNAGEVSIYRSRVEQQLSNMHFHLNELDQTVDRLRQQFRNLEIEIEAQVRYEWEKDGEADDPDFDPLELDRYSQLQQFSRALQESVSDLVSLQGLLSNHAREAETLLIQQSRVNTDLQDGLMRTRMLPFSRHAQRLRRIVRQTAAEEGKQVDLRLIGAEGEMDRQVLERITAPLEHLLRNAVIHGLETPEERARADKPESGLIAIELHREGSEVVIEVMDDGRGLNLPRIREKAEKRGLVRAGAELTEHEVMQLILEPGFSTAETVTQSAGRGVGMDVVHSEIKQLGGGLHMTSSQDVGTRFTIRLPYTLAITQALMVNAADEVFAIPLPSIEGIVRVPREEAAKLLAEEGSRYSYGGRYYQVQHLSAQLGLGRPVVPEDVATVPMLLVRVGDQSSALITEGMRGSREVVVKSVGPQIANIRGISGATIMGDGSIVLILDVGGLVRAGARPTAEIDIAEQEAAKAAEASTPKVMVVDDSITVRRVTQRLLERHNLDVITAKDGVDALSVLQDELPDIMLLDIEMPRMDGYELATHMRNDSRLKSIPIIMITSRTGEKHRNRAYEIGVDHYLGKPYQETELLEHIRALVGDFDPVHSQAGRE